MAIPGDEGHPRDAAGEPLLRALRDENEQLRAENADLRAEIAAMRTAQEALARHLKVTAPLRLIQEQVRQRSSERRRRGASQSSASAHRPALPPPALSIPDDQAGRHPLLARTRSLLAEGDLSPAPYLRPMVTGRTGRVAVVAHVFYPELWPELAERIERIPGPVDLVVTLVAGRSEALADAIVARFPEVVIEVVDNRGRDMWPFVRVLQLGLVGDHDAVLKLHTKASVHRMDGARWRGQLLDSLCPDASGIDLILELLRADAAVGMVGPAGGVLGREFWGANGLLVEALAVRTGIGVDPERTWFPGGSMFWARPHSLLRLRAAQLTAEDFEREAVSIDGTTAHALERFMGALAAADGLEVIAADEVAGRLARIRGAGPGRA